MPSFFKRAVATILAGVWFSFPLAAQDAEAPDVADLLAQLADPETENWQRVEARILDLWSRSGSPAMDLLLKRGQEAMEAEDFAQALEHFTALTDHAPDFAEGWNARATALFRLGLYGPAMEDIARALALNPDHFNAMTGLGVILQETGQDEQALAVYRMLEKIHPNQPQLQEAIRMLEGSLEGVDI